MSEKVIQAADLRFIEGTLKSLQSDVGIVSGQVDAVSQEVLATQSRIDQLVQDFHAYIQKDQLEKNIQLAETRLVKVRQEIETKFGHYGEVRRRVTGILQAVDANLVKKETIENASEEHMLAAPRYWLAPCLIALSAWLNDNKELAERAMLEALRRDDERTSLFFALVTRRGARYQVSREWLDRYFGLQDPHQLEREIVILIDGFTNGIFGPDARAKCSKHIVQWIEELSQKAGFVEEQQEQWKVALNSKEEPVSADAYNYLRLFSSSWSQLEQSMQGAKLHTIIKDYFSGILNQEVMPAQNIAYAVDALLDTLVSKFDDEELPLKRDERLYSLIIEEHGDRDLASNKFQSEKIFENRVTFTQLLTNFTMHPEQTNASIATQKLSLALSKEWIRAAHDDITAENRAGVPIQIALEVEDWKGNTTDGSNETDLLQSLTQHMHARRDQMLAQLKLNLKHWGALAGGIAFAVFGFGIPFLFVFAVLCFLYFYLGKRSVDKGKATVMEAYEKLLESSVVVMRAVLAEVVDWRMEYAKEDQKAAKVTELLESVSPEQFSFTTHDTIRSVL